ncbi:hypothetical protein GW17_00027466 [Ensete ventricosum]|nr:hypothetical protein GW17_00027466 [Ensete ventricosum]RZS14410.1 hypothetical protein BHM03_00046104 [Ensete ventricosum]
MSVQSTGAFIAVTRYASATPLPPSVLSRGIGWQVFRTALYRPVRAVHLLSSSAETGAAGLSFLQFCNLNSFRTKFILGLSVFMGLSVPQYFNEYTSVAGYGPVHTKARWVR